MEKKRPKTIKIPSSRVEDQPATRKMLSLVRDELRSDIRALSLRIGGVETKLGGLRTEFKADMDGLRTKLKADMEELKSSNFKMQLLLEEQNANNRIVLEGLQALWQRQDRIEASAATTRV
jgi:hypothetical protein